LEYLPSIGYNLAMSLHPFLNGLWAGYAIAIPVGAIAILIIDLALRHGFAAGFAAGAGAASVDLVYASAAGLAGQLLAGWLAPLSAVLHPLSACALIGLGVYGLWRVWQARRGPAPTAQTSSVTATHPMRLYAQFVGLTLINPATVAYFLALILGRLSGTLITVGDRLLFVLGVGLSSLSWQSLLALLGSLAHRRLTPRWQTTLSVAGNVMVMVLGAQMLLSF
jgi:threonine/homoserine/homoserine lactone efflux protein